MIRHGSSRWMPAENWCTFGTTKSGFEKSGPRPRKVSGPSELPGGSRIPLGQGFDRT